METTSQEVEHSDTSFERHPINYQPNAFTESRQEFTELEKKIVTLIINQVGHLAVNNTITYGKILSVTIPFSQLTKHNQDKVEAAGESLMTRKIYYRKDMKLRLYKISHPFTDVEFDIINGSRVIIVNIHPDYIPEFSELNHCYTKYGIDVMLSLSSIYAKRMFEIVSMYENRRQHQFTYSVVELMEMLNCVDRYNFNDFRRVVLGVAQRELEKKVGITLEWTPRKVGKKITELTFTFKTPQQQALEAVKQDRQVINQMSINEAFITAWQLMKNYQLKSWQKDLIVSEQALLEIFFRVDSEITSGLRTNVKNPTAYLVKSLGLDQMKAPTKKTEQKKSSAAPLFAPIPKPIAFDSTARTATPQSFGSIFSGMTVSADKPTSHS